MDYEKKYNEMVRRAKELYESGNALTRQQMEIVCPELTESEDEKIRKSLIKSFTNQHPANFPTVDGFTREQIIAYLEKQKEQKPVECGASNDESEYDRGYREGHKFGLSQTQEYMLPGGKTFSGLIPCWVNAPSTLQPAHKYHGKNVVIMHENNGGYRCCCIDDEKATTFHLPENTLFVEGWRRKKPAEWNTNDKAFIKDCARILDENGYVASAERLLSIFPVKPAEWSEEDERIRLACIATINDVIDYERDRWEDYNPGKPYRPITKYDEQIDWLKSLRPSWKPSEEQMKALEECGECKRCVKELYEQLKNL